MLKVTILSRSSCTETYGGLYTYSYPSQVLDTLPLICCSDAQINDRLDTLTIITESVEKRTPFEMASSKETAKEDREFISKLMQLDPRDRPSAKVLLQDPWLAEGTADSK